MIPNRKACVARGFRSCSDGALTVRAIAAQGLVAANRASDVN